MTTPIERAIKIAKGPVALARRLRELDPDHPVTYQAVSKWAKRGYAPPRRVLMIEAAVDGKVSRHELDPQMYPAEDAAA